MRKKLASLIAVASLAGGVLAVGGAPTVAAAAVGPGEDREVATPASGWWSYQNLTLAQLTATFTNNKSRPVDIHVTGTPAARRYTVAEVSNSGSYATAWYLNTNLTPVQVATTATSKNMRPIVLNCYTTSAGDRCATIMIANTGANAQSYKLYVGTLSYIQSKLTGTNRMAAFSRVQGTTRYSTVLVANTGTDAVSWWWYHGVSDTTLVNTALTKKARMIDFDHNDDTGTWNGVMYANTAGRSWYVYDNAALSTSVNRALQQGQRIFDVTPYLSGGTTKYAIVSANNLNPLSTSVAATVGPKVPNGRWGFELKQVGGATLAGLQNGVAFEPASSLKVLYHYKSIVAEQAGTTSDTTPISYQYDKTHSTDGDICPDSFNTVGNTNLKNADTLMMQQSDNRMTKGVYTKYGPAAVAAEATHLGMTHTVVKHNIGCPTASTHNATTLNDLAALYSAFANSSDITNATWRSQFGARMLNQSNYTPYSSSVCPFVKTQALAMGKSAATAAAFCAKITWIAKGGSYQYGNNAVTSPISWSNGSLTALPYKVNGTVFPRSFFYGDYFDQVTFSTAAAKTALSNARNPAYLAALKPYINAALATW
jgi:hypothetical protein